MHASPPPFDRALIVLDDHDDQAAVCNAVRGVLGAGLDIELLRTSLEAYGSECARSGEALADRLVDFVAAARAHLLVLARDDRSLGRTAALEEVVLRARVPVMIVPSRPVAVKRVLVPLDGSRVSHTALPLAARLTTGLARPLHLLSVVDPVRGLPPAFAYLPDTDPERRQIMGSLQYEANTNLDRAEADLRLHGIDATSALISGPTTRCLLGAVDPDDLVVMSTHGQHNTGQHRFGSVALRIVREATGPVLVLHPRMDVVNEAYTRCGWDLVMA